MLNRPSHLRNTCFHYSSHPIHHRLCYIRLPVSRCSSVKPSHTVGSKLFSLGSQRARLASIGVSERDGAERGCGRSGDGPKSCRYTVLDEIEAARSNSGLWNSQNAPDNLQMRRPAPGTVRRYAARSFYQTPNRPATESISSLTQGNRSSYRCFSRLLRRAEVRNSPTCKAHEEKARITRRREARLALKVKESVLARGLGHFRDKIISVRLSQDHRSLEPQIAPERISSSWNINFARIHNHFTRMAQARLLSTQSKEEVRESIPETIKTTLTYDSTGGYDKSLLNLIKALHWNPEEALLRLQRNFANNGTLLPHYVSKDSLQHLACVWLLDAEFPTSSHIETLHRTACDHLKTYGQRLGRASLSQLTVYLLAKHCSAEQLSVLVECLRGHDAHLHVHTKLHLMTCLMEHGRVGSALSLLQSIPYESLTPYGEQNLLRFCIKLLRANFDVDDLYGLRTSILYYMLKYGIKPDRNLTNVIILNAMEAYDYNTAWRSYEIATENGLRPDHFTYTALLKNANYNGSREKIDVVYNWARDDGTLQKRPRVRFELLYAMYIAQGQGQEARPFTTLLPRYGEFFELKPLRDIGILQNEQRGSMSYLQDPGVCLNEKISSQPHIAPVQPPRQAVGLMILAWLRECFDIEKAAIVYKHYIECIKDGHPVITQLANTTHTANAFMLAFGQDRRTLPLCAQIVQDMLKLEGVNKKQSSDASDPSSTTMVQSNEGDIVAKVAPPDAQTWNILVFAFTRNQQAEAAEKVLKIMQSRGIKPDKVTWSTLLSGYALMQDMDGTAKTLSRMDGYSVLSDEWIRKALGRVKNKAALIKAFGNAIGGIEGSGVPQMKQERV